MKRLLLALGLLLGALATFDPATAATATIYFDTGGCESGSTTRCSGTTDSASATVGSASATITCSATTYTGSTPGCSFSGTPNLSGVATDGSQAVFLNCATNANQKIFFISAVNDGSDLVQTTTTPTGCTASSSAWGIGGRMIYAPANWEAAIRAGDTVIFNNTPASRSGADFISVRVTGTGTAPIKIMGKAGVRPVLQITDTNNIVDLMSSSLTHYWFENLELDQDGASGDCIDELGPNSVVYNVKIIDCGGQAIDLAINSNGDPAYVLQSDISGAGTTAAIRINQQNHGVIVNNYIHDNAVDGIQGNTIGLATFILNNVIESNSGRGIQIVGGSAGGLVSVIANTIALNGNSGWEDALNITSVILMSNIFYNNGDAAGEYNFEDTLAAVELNGVHGYNIFHDSGSGDNLLNLTANATESTADPLFVDSANGDFRLLAGSPARLTGNPIVGLTTNTTAALTGYPDMGALNTKPPVGIGFLQ